MLREIFPPRDRASYRLSGGLGDARFSICAASILPRKSITIPHSRPPALPLPPPTGDFAFVAGRLWSLHPESLLCSAGGIGISAAFLGIRLVLNVTDECRPALPQRPSLFLPPPPPPPETGVTGVRGTSRLGPAACRGRRYPRRCGFVGDEVAAKKCTLPDPHRWHLTGLLPGLPEQQLSPSPQLPSAPPDFPCIPERKLRTENASLAVRGGEQVLFVWPECLGLVVFRVVRGGCRPGGVGRGQKGDAVALKWDREVEGLLMRYVPCARTGKRYKARAWCFDNKEYGGRQAPFLRRPRSRRARERGRPHEDARLWIVSLPSLASSLGGRLRSPVPLRRSWRFPAPSTPPRRRRHHVHPAANTRVAPPSYHPSCFAVAGCRQ